MAYRYVPLFFSYLAVVMYTTGLTAAPLPPPIIQAVNFEATPVEQYGKFEASIDLSASYTNPYDYTQVSVQATFTGPGISQTVDGFFMQDYTLDTNTGNLSLVGNGTFRVRFAPPVAGDWSFTVSVSDQTGTATSDSYAFLVTEALSPNNHGFLRTGNHHYLDFDDGTPFIAIGENMAWQNSNPYLNYSAWLEGLIQNGGNFIRLWHAHWGLGIEWKSGNGFQGLRQYKQSNCFYQDWLFDFCAEQGVYVMLTLQHHGQVSSQVNPNWSESPYNSANGGMCAGTVDFFTNEAAKAATRNRFRYVVARWGYARSVLCWELFNEVHWTDNFEANKELVAEWHIEMAEYLKAIDPEQRIVTTSYGESTSDETVWSDPNIDLTQTHLYLNVPNIEQALANGNRTFLETFDKPTLNGEFGLGGSVNLTNADPDGIHIHNALWGGLFSGAMGTGMSWWWDNYIHPKDLYYHYNGLSAVAPLIPFSAADLRPAPSYTVGAPGDLSLTPSLGWGISGTSDITIGTNGQIQPEDAALSLFLYGSEWNTQYKSPPNFNVSYPASSTFTVSTGNEMSTNPRILIKLDGSVLLDQEATTNSDYTINVPAGVHTITVDNNGTDWILIAAYTFEGIGSQLNSYVLTAADKSVIAGWALNKDYNHLYLAENGIPNTTPPAEIVLEGFPSGAFYNLQVFEPLTGALISTDVATASGGKLYIPVPAMLWDVAFLLEGEPVGTKAVVEQLQFSVSPNPVNPGGHVNLELSDLPEQITLLDATGRRVQEWEGQTLAMQLSADLPSGFYWLHIRQGRQVGLQPLVISR